MNKLAIRETFPPGIVGREIVLAQMCHHYRRVCRASARVDSNLQKPKAGRFLAFEETSFGRRTLTPRTPPKHRRCLKYELDSKEHTFKPTLRSQRAESRLRMTPKIYHPAVKPPKHNHQDYEGQQQGTQTSLENSLIEIEDQKVKDEASQTCHLGLYRPLDLRSVHFVRDVINEALRLRAFTSSALNRIFRDHQLKNAHSLTEELMDRELEELRRQLGMLPRYHQSNSIVSDDEALDALDTLVLDPHIKQQVIQSLRLARTPESKKPLFLYFDRLVDDEIGKSTTKMKNVQDFPDIKPRNDVTRQPEEEGDSSAESEKLNSAKESVIEVGNADRSGGWDAEICEEQKDSTSASSSHSEEEERANGDEDIEAPELTAEENENLSNSECEEEIEEDKDKVNTKKVHDAVENIPKSNEETTDLGNDIIDLEESEVYEDEGQESFVEDVESVISDGEVEEATSAPSSENEVLSESSDREDKGQSTSDETQVTYKTATESQKTSEREHTTTLENIQDTAMKSSFQDDGQSSAPQLQRLKLESTSSRDKWQSSLEVVQEECDSTIKEISDLSHSETPVLSSSERTS